MSYADTMNKIEALKSKRAELAAESRPLQEKATKAIKDGGSLDGALDAGQQERFKNLTRGIEKLDEELKALDAEYSAELLGQYKSGRLRGEHGDDRGGGSGRSGFVGGNVKGLAAEMLKGGFNFDANRLKVSGSAFDALKANDFPDVTDIARSAPVIVPMGMDKRFIWPLMPRENLGDSLSIQDFKQTARTLNGTVQRAVDSTSDKADLSVTIDLVNEAVKQHAVTIDNIPNAILRSMSQLSALLATEGEFQVHKSLDAHVMAQIVAASPPFGNTGANLIERVRNGITSMRAEGANPTLLVVNPTDAAALDLLQYADGVFIFPINGNTNGDPLWNIRVIERIGAGTEPPYLLDPQMLGVLYLGAMDFDADPYTGFKKNLTTLRVETTALMHVRNAKGARRIAAS